MDFINETWNGMVFAATQHSAFWTTPGDTALRVMVGWNLEIIFMFSIAGIVYYYSLYEDKDKKISPAAKAVARAEAIDLSEIRSYSRLSFVSLISNTVGYYTESTIPNCR